MVTTADYAYEDARDGLAEAIRGVQPNCTPREVAREILAYDVPNHSHLIGVSLSGNAYFYHCTDRYAISVAIDRDGLSNGGPIRASWDESSPNIDHWTWKRRDWWKWVHPRYRW